jgi:NADPH:quinone reductase-like Zn-dependent oxidoreductase
LHATVETEQRIAVTDAGGEWGSILGGTAALPLTDAPLRAIAEGISAGRIPSLRVRTFDFGDVRQAHALMESDRALGKLVVRV